jgi:hypothetical protein
MDEDVPLPRMRLDETIVTLVLAGSLAGQSGQRGAPWRTGASYVTLTLKPRFTTAYRATWCSPNGGSAIGIKTDSGKS